MIFIRPLVIRDASLEGDLAGYRKQLPSNDFFKDTYPPFPEVRKTIETWSGANPRRSRPPRCPWCPTRRRRPRDGAPVSLLLDALKRAEQEKLARQGEASNDAAPAQAGSAVAKPAPNLELQPVSSPPAATASSARPEESAHAAQVMFDAKSPRPEEQRGRGMLWATLGAIAVVVGSAAAYVLVPDSRAEPDARARRRSPRDAATPAAGCVERGAAPDERDDRGAAHAHARDRDRGTRSRAARGFRRTRACAARLARGRGGRTHAARSARRTRVGAAQARAHSRPAHDSRRRGSGYEALRRGDLAAARRRYETALAADPANVDAQLGIATVEARDGNRCSRPRHYRRVLEMDPRNATALAGLAALAE